MRHEPVHAVPLELVLGVVPGFQRERDAGLEQPLAVGAHLAQVADAEAVVLGAGPADAADDPVALRMPVGPAEHHGRRSGTESQRGELGADVVGGGVVGGQPLQRGFLGLPRPFGVHEQGVVRLAGVDHGAGQLDAVDEAEAGVGQIEVQTAGRQPELVVHHDCGGGLQVISADRRVDHHADLGGRDAGLGERLGAGHGGRVGEAHVRRPPAPLLDPGQLLQHAGLQSDAIVGVLQPLVERGRRHGRRRLHGAHREHGGVVLPEASVAAHTSPFPRDSDPGCRGKSGQSVGDHGVTVLAGVPLDVR